MEKEEPYREFLELCGFEYDEIPGKMKPLKRALKRVLIEPEDVKFAVENRIPRTFDTELKGVRKLFRAYVNELIDLTNVKEYKERKLKILYGILPTLSTYYYAAKEADPEGVYISFPDVFLTMVLGTIFHKLNPYLEAAEERGLSYGGCHCALNKVRYGARILQLLPPGDLSWIWGFICDEAPKTEELCHFWDGTKYYVLRMPHDTPIGHREDEDDERIRFLADQFREGVEKLQREIGIVVTSDILKKVMSKGAALNKKLFRVCELMKSSPMPLSGVDFMWFATPIGTPFNTGLDGIDEALDILIKELEHRVANGEGVLPEGAPAILKDCVLPQGTPWIIKLLEESDVGVPYPETYTPLPKELTPSRFQDPYMAAAETWLKTSTRVNAGYRAELICQKIRYYNLDGVLLGGMVFDRWWGTEYFMIKRLIEDKIGVPCLYIEADIWEDRDYSPETLRTRLETFAEIVKMYKATRS